MFSKKYGAEEAEGGVCLSVAQTRSLQFSDDEDDSNRRPTPVDIEDYEDAYSFSPCSLLTEDGASNGSFFEHIRSPCMSVVDTDLSPTSTNTQPPPKRGNFSQPPYRQRGADTPLSIQNRSNFRPPQPPQPPNRNNAADRGQHRNNNAGQSFQNVNRQGRVNNDCFEENRNPNPTSFHSVPRRLQNQYRRGGRRGGCCGHQPVIINLVQPSPYAMHPYYSPMAYQQQEAAPLPWSRTSAPIPWLSTSAATAVVPSGARPTFPDYAWSRKEMDRRNAKIEPIDDEVQVVYESRKRKSSSDSSSSQKGVQTVAKVSPPSITRSGGSKILPGRRWFKPARNPLDDIIPLDRLPTNNAPRRSDLLPVNQSETQTSTFAMNDIVSVPATPIPQMSALQIQSDEICALNETTAPQTAVVEATFVDVDFGGSDETVVPKSKKRFPGDPLYDPLLDDDDDAANDLAVANEVILSDDEDTSLNCQTPVPDVDFLDETSSRMKEIVFKTFPELNLGGKMDG